MRSLLCAFLAALDVKIALSEHRKVHTAAQNVDRHFVPWPEGAAKAHSFGSMSRFRTHLQQRRSLTGMPG